MENQTSFDLSHAIQQWRRHLEQSSAFQRSDLDELESHLRDSMPALQSAGLSAEEAFMIASRRIGPRQALELEFRKSSSQSPWLGRIVWLCIIIQMAGLILELSRIAGMPLMVAFVVLLGLAFMTGSSTGQRIAKRFLARPAAVAAVLLLLSLSHKVVERSFLWPRTPVYYPVLRPSVPVVVTSEFWYVPPVVRFLNGIPELVACAALIAMLFKARRTEQRIAAS